MSRLLLGGLLAIAVCACGGGSPPTRAPDAATTAPGGQQATPVVPVATPAPGGGGGAGSVESIARSLAPIGALELSHAAVGNSYTLQLSSPQSGDQLKTFWDQRIPAAGLTQTGKFDSQGTVTYAFSNPDGGIVATPDGSGNYLITISVGSSV